MVQKAFLAVCAAVPWVLCAASCRLQRGMGAAEPRPLNGLVGGLNQEDEK